MQKLIKINDLTLNISTGNSVTFQGKHSGKTLSGIDFDFIVSGKKNAEKVDELFTLDAVQVTDPFAQRSYDAQLRKVSSSYQEGRPEFYYSAEIREIDIPPKFDLLEVEGICFNVMKYNETDEENDSIGRRILLKLSDEQFLKLQEIQDLETVKVKRIGVDVEPIIMRFGGAMYWSKHEENGEKYYKQIIRLFPLSLPPSSFHLASGNEQIALSRMILSLSVRFEALINELVQKNILSTDRRTELLSENSNKLLARARIDEIFWQISKVDDAEKEFD